MLNTQRIAAIRKWIGVVSSSLNSFDIGRKWNRLAPLGASLAESLKDVFAGKSTGTLHARVGPILRYVAWTHDRGLVPFPLVEATVYNFMVEHNPTAPTFLRSFLVSLRFTHYLLELSGAEAVIASQRIIGRARNAYLEKRRLLQKDPFTVEMVVAMEEFVCNTRQPARERFVIGCFLICTFMRARFSDMQHLVDLVADRDDVEGVPLGYVEGQVTRSKTSYTTERKTMFLPMTSPRCCLTGKDWFSAWTRARLESSVPRGAGMPLFPALAKSGWSRVPIGAGAAAEWLRNILGALRFDLSHRNLGTHSAKVATLSWMAKFGIPLEVRQLLGYHTKGGSVLVYSRDALSGPLRDLCHVLSEIRQKRFIPDQTRSGYFPATDRPEVPGTHIEEVAVEVGGSDSEDSQDDEHLHEDMAIVEDSTDKVVDSWSEYATVQSLGLGEEPLMFRNTSTRYIHVAADESGTHFRCGRPVNQHYTQLPEAPAFCSPQCRQCFRS